MSTLREEMEEAADGLTIEDGVIQDSGKFEMENWYVPYFWGIAAMGSADEEVEIDGTLYAFIEPTIEEREIIGLTWKYLLLWESDTGFVNCDTVAEETLERMQREAEEESSYEYRNEEGRK